MAREALSRHAASGNGQLLWCRCAARLFHGRGHIVIHLFQDTDSWYKLYQIIKLMVWFSVRLVCYVSMENPWGRSTNLAHAQTMANCHLKITLPGTPGILVFYFKDWYQSSVISVNSCKEQKCCYLVEIKCDIMVGWSANMSSKSHCPRSPHRLSCILEPQADANKMLVPTVSRRYRHAAQMTPVLKTSRAKMRVYQALDLL